MIGLKLSCAPHLYQAFVYLGKSPPPLHPVFFSVKESHEGAQCRMVPYNLGSRLLRSMSHFPHAPWLIFIVNKKCRELQPPTKILPNFFSTVFLMWAGENSTSKLEFLNYKIVKNTSAKTKEVKFRKGEDVF